MSLEDVHLALRYGHALGPVIDNPPSLRIMDDWTAASPPPDRLPRVHQEVGRQSSGAWNGLGDAWSSLRHDPILARPVVWRKISRGIGALRESAGGLRAGSRRSPRRVAEVRPLEEESCCGRNDELGRERGSRPARLGDLPCFSTLPPPAPVRIARLPPARPFPAPTRSTSAAASGSAASRRSGSAVPTTSATCRSARSTMRSAPAPSAPCAASCAHLGHDARAAVARARPERARTERGRGAAAQRGRPQARLPDRPRRPAHDQLRPGAGAGKSQCRSGRVSHPGCDAHRLALRPARPDHRPGDGGGLRQPHRQGPADPAGRAADRPVRRPGRVRAVARAARLEPDRHAERPFHRA